MARAAAIGHNGRMVIEKLERRIHMATKIDIGITEKDRKKIADLFGSLVGVGLDEVSPLR